MAQSYDYSPGDGVQTDWTVPFQYIDQSHVKVRVDGVEVSFTWLSVNTIRVTPAVAEGSVIGIFRETPTAQLTTFSNTNNLTAENLNLAETQSLFVAVEARERAEQSIVVSDVTGQYDFAGKRATNVGAPVDEDDAVTKAYADTITTQTVAAAAAQVTLAAAQASTATTKAELATTKAAEAVAARDDSYTARTDTYAARDATFTARDQAVTAKDGAEAALASLNPSSFANAAQGAKADTALQPGDRATKAEILADTADKLVDVDGIWDANAITPLGNISGTVTIDLSSGVNFSATQIGHVTFALPSNWKSGQTFAIWLSQDAAGGKSISFSGWYPLGAATPTWSSVGSGLNVIYGQVNGAGNVVIYSGGKIV